MHNLEDRFRELIADIHSKNDHVRSGGSVDMSGLDQIVTTLCEEVKVLESHEAHQIKNIMADMINALDTLAESLKEQRKA